MQPYEPSNKVPFLGLTLLFLATLIGSLLLGYLIFAISKLFYLVFLFPIGAGLAGGYLIRLAVKSGKVRNPVVALIFGLLTGLLIYGTYTHADYQSFTQDVYQQLLNSPEIATSLKQSLTPAIAADLVLKYKTNTTGFWGYLKYVAKVGIKISSFRHSSHPLTLNEFFSWFYLVIELLIYSLLAGMVAWSAAKEPFCEFCEKWYTEKTPIGTASIQLREAIIGAIENNDLKKAGELLTLNPVSMPRVDLFMQKCPNCQVADIMLTVSEVFNSKKNEVKTKELLQAMAEASCVREMIAMIKK